MIRQEFYHPPILPPDAKDALQQAEKRLRDFADPETKSIFAPLLGDAAALTSLVLARAAALRAKAKHLIVIGSGGSGLGGKVFSALNTKPDGHTLHVLDSCDLFAARQLMHSLNPAESALLLVSKSGTTVETLVYADLFLCWMKSLHDVAERVTVMTMPNQNILHQQAQSQRWTCLPHDADLCGRFSIFSPVALLPAAFLGMDINALIAGAVESWNSPEAAREAAAFCYTAMQRSHPLHVCIAYGERFAPLADWWRQGVAESLGKQGRGIFPVCAQGTRDQHSQLQLYLDGPSIAVFTLLTEESKGRGDIISQEALLPAIRNYAIGDIIQSQQMATLATLNNAGRPIRHVHFPSHDVRGIGALLSQWTQEIILLGYMLNINPFDQPAVEESKRLARDFLQK